MENQPNDSAIAHLPRLDVLLYAHDGRGLGHASRTIAIGMALRRLRPDYRVLLVTGCALARELIGPAALDWIKLPSYETIVENGKSKGVRGKSNFDDHYLGTLRTQQIAQIIETYRPRLVLADHSPQGKHRELLAALQAGKNNDITWVLGIRSVIGQVGQVQSPMAASIFKQYYSALLWYGDSTLLGNEQLREIENHFGITAVECGYVSRLQEIRKSSQSPKSLTLAGTISVPWFGETTPLFLKRLYNVLRGLGKEYGHWLLFLDPAHQNSAEIYALFRQLPWCSVEEPSQHYLDAMLQSKCAIIYGGYNSLMDVISIALPALVIVRDMNDGEQQHHLDKLLQSTQSTLAVLAEDCQETHIAQSLHTIINQNHPKIPTLNLEGAENAAQCLIKTLPHSL